MEHLINMTQDHETEYKWFYSVFTDVTVCIIFISVLFCFTVRHENINVLQRHTVRGQFKTYENKQTWTDAWSDVWRPLRQTDVLKRSTHIIIHRPLPAHLLSSVPSLHTSSPHLLLLQLWLTLNPQWKQKKNLGSVNTERSRTLCQIISMMRQRRDRAEH